MEHATVVRRVMVSEGHGGLKQIRQGDRQEERKSQQRADEEQSRPLFATSFSSISLFFLIPRYTYDLAASLLGQVLLLGLTSNAGFLLKKFLGLSNTLTGSAGMTG
jgi:hypothetical protein